MSVRLGLMCLLPLLGCVAQGAQILTENLNCQSGYLYFDERLPRDAPIATWQEVRWVGPGQDVLYTVALTPVELDRVGVRLEVKNLGNDSVLILLDRDWRAGIFDESIALSLGLTAGSYGNELPALKPLPPGACLLNSSWVDLPEDDSLEYIGSVDVGFCGMFSDWAGITPSLESLEEVSGWWQTSDIDLAEHCYAQVAYPMVSFSLPPQRLESSP